MSKNKLKLNDDKTEFLICGSACSLKKVKTEHIKIGDQLVKKSKNVRNIGVIFDEEMKMAKHINNLCKGAWYNLYRIGKIRSYMTADQTATVIHAYVTSRLDNCNALLYGLPKTLTDRIQLIQNAAAKLLTKTKKREHVTPILRQLHWLPVSQRIIFKLLCLFFKSFKCNGPAYLSDLVTPYKPSRLLRSSSDPHILVIPKTKSKTYGDRAISVAVPVLWNALPLAVKSSQSIDSFKVALKTYLFRLYFN